MKIVLNRLIAMSMFVLAIACTDESLDPFRLNEIEKGSILALRGPDGTSSTADSEANFFFKDNIFGNEQFSYIADFLSEDQTSLAEVQVFARILTGPRCSGGNC